MSKIPLNRSSLSPTKIVFRQPRTPIGSQPTNRSGGNSSNSPLRIGDRVSNSGKSGTVAFIGRTQFAEGLVQFN
jgi:hypothetical protein